MSNLRREVGFLGAISKSTCGSLLWPEGVIALAIGGGGGITVLNLATQEERYTLIGDSLQLLGVLLGVVFAAFALLIALFSDEYIRLMKSASGGVLAFFRPFIIAIGVQVIAVFLAMIYRAIGNHVDSRVEVGMFLAWAFLFAFALADVIALTRAVSLHGYARAMQVSSEGDGTVRSLREKTN